MGKFGAPAAACGLDNVEQKRSLCRAAPSGRRVLRFNSAALLCSLRVLLCATALKSCIQVLWVTFNLKRCWPHPGPASLMFPQAEFWNTHFVWINNHIAKGDITLCLHDTISFIMLTLLKYIGPVFFYLSSHAKIKAFFNFISRTELSWIFQLLVLHFTRTLPVFCERILLNLSVSMKTPQPTLFSFLSLHYTCTFVSCAMCVISAFSCLTT